MNNNVNNTQHENSYLLSNINTNLNRNRYNNIDSYENTSENIFPNSILNSHRINSSSSPSNVISLINDSRSGQTFNISFLSFTFIHSILMISLFFILVTIFLIIITKYQGNKLVSSFRLLSVDSMIESLHVMRQGND